MNVHKNNLIDALQIAIREQGKWEQEHGYIADSAVLAGWKSLLKAVKRGEQITILQENG